MGLPERHDIPLISMVTRLTKQKGLDLVRRIMHELLEEQDIQLIVLGTGNANLKIISGMQNLLFMRSAERILGLTSRLPIKFMRALICF